MVQVVERAVGAEAEAPRGKKAASVEELLSVMREMKKRLATYEERVKPLPDAKTTWIPSTLIGLMDRESLTHVRKAGAQMLTR